MKRSAPSLCNAILAPHFIPLLQNALHVDCDQLWTSDEHIAIRDS
jgi:hypothetical protein